MDFYEELGINSDATEEEIRRSHRKLIKLLHPDGQSDDDLKALAEIQLRRINAMVDLLYNAERRREYDDHLKRGDGSLDPTNRSSFSPVKRKLTWRSASWMTLSLLAAIIITILGVRFWADHVRSASRPTEIASSSTSSPTPAPTNAAPKPDPAPASSTTVAVVPTGEPDQTSRPATLEGVWDWKTANGVRGKLAISGFETEGSSRQFKWRLTRTASPDSSGNSQSGTAVLERKPAKPQ